MLIHLKLSLNYFPLFLRSLAVFFCLQIPIHTLSKSPYEMILRLIVKLAPRLLNREFLVSAEQRHTIGGYRRRPRLTAAHHLPEQFSSAASRIQRKIRGPARDRCYFQEVGNHI